jgi:hypothetical protein
MIISLLTEFLVDKLFLLLYKSVLADHMRATCLNVAIRDAWWTLAHNEPLVTMIVSSLLNDGVYIDYLTRRSGLEQMKDYRV